MWEIAVAREIDRDKRRTALGNLGNQVLVWLAEALPADVKVLIVADHGFGDHMLYRVLTEELKFDYLIRFRGNIKITAAEGETRAAVTGLGRPDACASYAVLP